MYADTANERVHCWQETAVPDSRSPDEDLCRSFRAVAEAFLLAHLGGLWWPISGNFDGSTIEFKAGRELIPVG
jgi:hypothetical protein